MDSVAVTAMTKKLKAKWTPELGQDLNAYHNLDAEVELTSILSEQIALEIDRRSLRTSSRARPPVHFTGHAPLVSLLTARRVLRSVLLLLPPTSPVPFPSGARPF